MNQRPHFLMDSKKLRKQYISAARRIVVKIGTNVISAPDSAALDVQRVDALSEQVAVLAESGRQVAVVSSGAIGAGMKQLGMRQRPGSLPALQAAASVGQSKLVSCYDRSFRKHGLHAGQILLTRDDFDSRQRYLNAANTIHALFENGCVPVINENDTIGTEEIQFGDNDQLAAFVTHLIKADLLILLSTVPGLCTEPPFSGDMAAGECDGTETQDVHGRPVDVVRAMDRSVAQLAGDQTSPDGTGGMRSKLAAVRIAVDAGQTAVIADGRADNVLTDIMEGKKTGTLFLPAGEKLRSRKLWIRFTRRPGGIIEVDAGAAAALKDKGKSLLPAGIVSVKGEFKRGDTVAVQDGDGKEIARGLTNYSAEDIRRIKGLRTEEIRTLLGRDGFDEVIHRDNMALV